MANISKAERRLRSVLGLLGEAEKYFLRLKSYLIVLEEKENLELKNEFIMRRLKEIEELCAEKGDFTAQEIHALIKRTRYLVGEKYGF